MRRDTGTGTGTDMDTSRQRLWQLISPTLPVGAYSYSTGLESAVMAGWVHDRASAEDWMLAQCRFLQARVDLPALQRLYQAWQNGDEGGVIYWNRWLWANRETAELRTEDVQQGAALARLLPHLGVVLPESFAQWRMACWATVFAKAGVVWGIPVAEIMQGYLWSWCENQTAAAIKLIPLGQTHGQQLLASLGEHIPATVAEAQRLEDAELGASLPGLAMASAWHEIQYSRLFRS